jgi:hypothetical protein
MGKEAIDMLCASRENFTFMWQRARYSPVSKSFHQVRFTTMQDKKNEQANDETDPKRQQEQAQVPPEQNEKTEVKKSKKARKGFTGIAAHQMLKQKIFDILNGGK